MKKSHDFYTDIIVKYFKDNFNWIDFEICSDSKNDYFPRVDSIKIKNNFTDELILKIPDFSAINHNSFPRISILGEAKTYKDFLEASKRRDEQIDYMMQFLKVKEKPYLIYSLPFQLLCEMKLYVVFYTQLIAR